MKKIVCLLLAFVMLVSITGCFSSDITGTESSQSSKYEFVGEIEMLVDYDSYLGYSVNIKGKLKNTSGQEFSYVSVTFAIYDAEGNQIETALDNMNYLQPNSTWAFDASMLGWSDVRPHSYKLVEVSAW